jgi:hypothetical protein
MKLFRFALNIWITIVSVLSFLAGWVALAHAPKPAQPQHARVSVVSPAVVLPTLTPLQDLQGSSGTGFQSYQVQIPSNNYVPPAAPATVFSTGGS